MPHIHSFAPIEGNKAKLLILGSMPGEASLQADEYYAHPRNAFWRIMGSLIALDPAASYQQREQALKNANIALWDVLYSCVRPGSLDSNINKSTQQPNNFEAFFNQHQNITHVFFNGATAEQTYRKLVLPNITKQRITYLRLPSTSPANASISFEHKLQAWQAIHCISSTAILNLNP